MSIRYFIPGVLWVCLMVLIFITPTAQPPITYLNTIPARSLLDGFMFLGFVHLWCSALKRQLKHERLRRGALFIVFGVAVLLAASTEITLYATGVNQTFVIWNLIFEIIGSGAGILTFKLLYQHCY